MSDKNNVFILSEYRKKGLNMTEDTLDLNSQSKITLAGVLKVISNYNSRELPDVNELKKDSSKTLSYVELDLMEKEMSIIQNVVSDGTDFIELHILNWLLLRVNTINELKFQNNLNLNSK